MALPVSWLLWSGILAAAAAACAGPRPPGEAAEREVARAAGEAFAQPHEARPLTALPEDAALGDTLRYAFLSSAGIERAYHEWRAALERIPQAVSLENPRLSFEWLFSDERMTRWDRTTLGAAQGIPFPGKRALAGEQALADALAARRRFEDAKFALQADVVTAWHELALVDRRVAIAGENVELLRELAETARGRVQVGLASQADASKAELEVGTARNEQLRTQAERTPALARLNALLSRPADLPLRPATAILRAPLPPRDAEIVALAAERNSELQALASEVAASEAALSLARRQYLPDFEIGATIEGSLERTVMGAIDVPLRFSRIQAGIRESEAVLRAAQAALRARRDDLRAQVVLQLFLARNAEREATLLEETLIPRAREIVDATETAYATGGASFLDLLDAQRGLLALRLAVAEAVATRASAVAALEALCALDFGTLS